MSDHEIQKVMWDSGFAETGPNGQNGFKWTATDKGSLRRRPFGSVCYFDMLEGFAALALASASLTVAVGNVPGWLWNYKDSLGFGLFLCTMLAFILLRRRVSAQRMPWLHVCIAASTIAAGVVLFRRWSGAWVGVAAMIPLFALGSRSQTAPDEPASEDISKVLLVVGSLLLIASLVEGTLRLLPQLLSEGARTRIFWHEAINKSWHVSHPYIGHLHNVEFLRTITARPSSATASLWREPARFDAWGFRNSEPWPERVDMITVGDSMTYNLTVKDEQAWTALLERSLAPRRALNLGLVGAAPQQYLRVYETFGAKLSPKVLFVGLFLRTDLGDAAGFESWSKSESHENFIEFMLKQAPLKPKGWFQKLYLHALFEDVTTFYRSGPLLQGKTMQLTERATVQLTERATVQLTDGGRVQVDPSVLAREAGFNSPGLPAFALVLKTIEDLQALATQAQTHCLFLFFPSKEEVYLPIFGEAADLAAPFLPELDKRGIAYLDLGPHFRRRAAAGETLFWDVDVHPNARGNALIAEVVLAYLRVHTARFELE